MIVRVLDVANKRPGGGSKFEDNAVAFYENDRQDVLIHHNKLLYMKASVKDVELTRVLAEHNSLSISRKSKCLETE